MIFHGSECACFMPLLTRRLRPRSLNLILGSGIGNLPLRHRLSLAVDNGDFGLGRHPTGSLGQNPRIHFGSSGADCVLYESLQILHVNNRTSALSCIFYERSVEENHYTVTNENLLMENLCSKYTNGYVSPRINAADAPPW
jgi:hypothetical protein